MDQDEKSRLDADVAAAEAEVSQRRADNAKLAEDFRNDPNDDKRELLRRGAALLANARDRLDLARASREVFDTTGSTHGLIAKGGRISGTIAVPIKAGASREERDEAIDAALHGAIEEAAAELGAVLAAVSVKYTRERPGRDAQGRTVFEVAGRMEGDRLVPAVSRAAKNLRKN